MSIATMDPVAFIDAVIDRMQERGLIAPKREAVTISLAELVTETGLGERTLRRRLNSPSAPKRLEGRLHIYNRSEALRWAGRAKA